MHRAGINLRYIGYVIKGLQCHLTDRPADNSDAGMCVLIWSQQFVYLFCLFSQSN
jgi:hypothetical protein